MTALALVYRDAGWEVQGSDSDETQITDKLLKNNDIKVFSRFTPRNVSKIENSKWKPIIDRLIYTGAHHGFRNVEVQWARSRGIPVHNYAAALGDFFKDKKQICVCGVGGKTTVSAMIATILEYCGQEPSWIVGTGEIFTLPASGRWSRKGQWAVIESDEYWADPIFDKHSKFHYLNPRVIICTNIRHDHPDAFPTEKEFVENFWDYFISNRQLSSLIHTNARVNGNISKYLLLSNQAEGVLSKYIPNWKTELEKRKIERLIYDSDKKEMAKLAKAIKVPGEHNVRNGMAAVAAAQVVGIDRQKAIAGLSQYKGAKRRFEYYGSVRGVDIYDDYAHHPHEIISLIKSAREKFGGRRLRIVFHPHTYSRTKAFFEEFAEVLAQADETVMVPIFASAREKTDPEVTSDKLSSQINIRGGKSVFIKNNEKLVDYLSKTAKSGDVILTVGAGDIYKIIPDLIKKIR